MFALDHRRDFDAVLAATAPFALVRFGDGEAAILAGRKHTAAAGEWISEGEHWLRPALQASLVRNAPGYCIGVPPGCCLRGVMGLIDHVTVPDVQRTYATLFLHGNLRRMSELIARHKPHLVGPGLGTHVPKDGMATGVDLDAIVLQMMDVDRSMLVAAGPLANVLVDLYWQRQSPERRQIVLDVGSALDFHLYGKPTRQYHSGALSSHHCSMAAAPLAAGRVARSSAQIQSVRTARGTTTMAVTTRSGSVNIIPSRTKRIASTQTSPRAPGRSAQIAAVGAPVSNPAGDGTAAAAAPVRKRCTKCVRVVRSRS